MLTLLGALIGCIIANAMFYAWGVRKGFQIIADNISQRLALAHKQKNLGGDADEFLRLEGEIRAYVRILTEGPVNDPE